MTSVALTTLTSVEEIFAVNVLIKSLRAFGGPYSDIPIYIYSSLNTKERLIESDGRLHVISCALEEPLHSYPFAYKVFAISDIEKHLEDVPEKTVWLDSSSVILKSPALFALQNNFEIALRPVHIKNIGLSFGAEIDGYWKKIYSMLDLDHTTLHSMRTYVDEQEVFPYFNCGMFVIDSQSKVLKLWWQIFEKLVEDTYFQNSHCTDYQHRLFLHQSIFSAVVSKVIPTERILMLPPEYGYPLHFHTRLGLNHKQVSLDDMVIMLGYREDMKNEEKLNIFNGSGRLRAWLRENAIEIMSE